MIALAKAQPGKLSYASPGVGTPQHIAGELLKRQAGIDIVHVPYRGAVFTDVIGGRVTMTLQNMGSILPMVRQGQLRGLAVTSREAHADHAGSADDRGIRPAGLRGDLLVRADGAGRYAGADHHQGLSAGRQDRDGAGDEGQARAARPRRHERPPDAFAAIIKADIAKWAKVIKDANIKAEMRALMTAHFTLRGG